MIAWVVAGTVFVGLMSFFWIYRHDIKDAALKATREQDRQRRSFAKSAQIDKNTADRINQIPKREPFSKKSVRELNERTKQPWPPDPL